MGREEMMAGGMAGGRKKGRKRDFKTKRGRKFGAEVKGNKQGRKIQKIGFMVDEKVGGQRSSWGWEEQVKERPLLVADDDYGKVKTS